MKKRITVCAALVAFCAIAALLSLSCGNPAAELQASDESDDFIDGGAEKLGMDIKVIRTINMSSADAFEPDNTRATAKPITVGAAVQEHNFFDNAADWLSFAGTAGSSYTIETWVFGNADTALTLYNGTAVKAKNDDKGDGSYGSRIVFTPAATKTYTIKVASYGSKKGANRGYTVSVTGGAAPQPPLPIALPQAKKAWTVLVYMDGDNSLSSFCAGNVNQMKQVGSDASALNIVLLYDNGSSMHGYYYVQQGAAVLLQNMANPDMGSAATAKGFIDYAAANFPAEKYAFVFWNHGGGVDRGVCWDDSSGSHLSEVSQKAILEYGLSRFGKPFELVGFDACLMATAEICYQYRGLARYMAASEQTEPGAGWDYSALQAIKAAPAAGGEILAKSICSKYAALAGTDGPDWTFAAIDLSCASALGAAIDGFSAAAIASGADCKAAFKNLAAVLPAFGAGDGQTGTTKDLTAYMTAIGGSPILPQSVKDEAGSLRDLIANRLVIQNQSGSTWSGKAFGCAITMKSDSSVYDRLDLNADTKWNEFCAFAGFPNAY